MPELMAIIREQGWSENTPGNDIFERTDIECPYFPGQPVLDSSCTDGQRASWDPVNNRRRDSQGLSFPEGIYCIDYAFRMTAVPTFRNDWGWNLVGPEMHDSGLPQATIQPQVMPCTVSGAQGTSTPRRDPALPEGTLRYFLDANAGGSTHRYFDLGPAPVGVTDDAYDLFRMLVFYTQSSSGFIKIWRDGVLIRTVLGVTVGKVPAGYMKMANYSREVWVDGLQRYQIAGRIYECSSESDVPPMPTIGEPPPPPPPAGTCDEVRAQLAVVTAERDMLELEAAERETYIASLEISVQTQDAQLALLNSKVATARGYAELTAATLQ